jgi:hypothetical protein
VDCALHKKSLTLRALFLFLQTREPAPVVGFGLRSHRVDLKLQQEGDGRFCLIEVALGSEDETKKHRLAELFKASGLRLASNLPNVSQSGYRIDKYYVPTDRYE